MDAKILAEILHDIDRLHYKGKVGDLVHIDLPRVPMTRDTEFLQLRVETTGNSIEDPFLRAVAEAVEGLVSPTQIVKRGVRPGTSQVIVRAYDALSGDEVEGVDPLEITVDIDE